MPRPCRTCPALRAGSGVRPEDGLSRADADEARADAPGERRGEMNLPRTRGARRERHGGRGAGSHRNDLPATRVAEADDDRIPGAREGEREAQPSGNASSGRGRPDADAPLGGEPAVEIATWRVERQTRPAGRLQKTVKPRPGDFPSPAKAHRGAVRIDEHGPRERLPISEERAVSSDLGMLDREGVGQWGPRHEDEALERAVPEELLGGEAFVAKGRLYERGIAELRVVHDGRIARDDVGADASGERVVVGDGPG